MTPPEPEPLDAASAETPARHGSLLAGAMAYWVASAAGLAGGILRGKVAAVVLGTSGVGVTAQLSTLATLIGTLAALGVGTGGIKVIASARGQGTPDQLRRTVSLLLWLPFAAGLFAFGASAAFAEPLSSALLGDQQYAGLLVVSMSSIPLSCLLASLQVVLQGYERAGRLAVNSIVAAAVTTAASVPLTIAYGVNGAVAATPLAVAMTVAFFVVRDPWIVRMALPLSAPGRGVRRELVHLAGASFLASALTLATDTLLRSAAVHQLGLADNGLYQPAQTFTAVLMAQAAGALTLVLLPRLAFHLGERDAEQARVTVQSAAHSVLIIVVPVCVLAAALSQVFIVLLFDRSFLTASGVLAVQAAGELPRFLAYTLGAVLLPAGLVREWLVAAVLANIARLAVGLALLPSLGLYALALGSVVMWWVTLTWTMHVVRRRLDWRTAPATATMLAVGTVVVTVSVGLCFTGTWGRAAAVAAAVGWVAVTGRKEVRQVLAVLRHRLHATPG